MIRLDLFSLIILRRVWLSCLVQLAHARKQSVACRVKRLGLVNPRLNTVIQHCQYWKASLMQSTNQPTNYLANQPTCLCKAITQPQNKKWAVSVCFKWNIRHQLCDNIHKLISLSVWVQTKNNLRQDIIYLGKKRTIN